MLALVCKEHNQPTVSLALVFQQGEGSSRGHLWALSKLCEPSLTALLQTAQPAAVDAVPAGMPPAHPDVQIPLGVQLDRHLQVSIISWVLLIIV